MSSLVLTGDTSGQVSLTVPAIAGLNIATIPASTGNVLMDSTVGVCRAWVNYKGTATRAINASFNVTSVTFNATGDYTINFTNAISDANYCVGGTGSVPTLGTTNSRAGIVSPVTLTTTTLRIQTAQNSDNGANPGLIDVPIVSVAVLR
jgi:hypothetical protein